MRLFTPAHDRALGCDAFVVRTDARARRFVVATATPPDAIVAALLDRVVLIGRSLHDVRERTFAIFAGCAEGGFTVAVSEPFHDGLLSAVRDVLQDFGDAHDDGEASLAETPLFPLLGYERGRVAFFDGPDTRAWRPLAGNRALRIVAAALSHAPRDDVFVGDVPLRDYLAAPEEDELSLDPEDPA